MAVSNEWIDPLLAGDKKPEDLIGETGLLKPLTERLGERALEAESLNSLSIRQRFGGSLTRPTPSGR